MTIYYQHPVTGVRREAVRNAKGAFTLGDPKLGDEKKKAENAIYECSEASAVEKIEKEGHSIRVETPGNRPSLVRRYIFADGRRLT